jgi:ATP/ADP translocase
MSLIGNFAPVMSGLYVTSLAKYLQGFTPLSQEYIFELSLKYSSVVMVGSIAMIAFLHNLLHNLSRNEQMQQISQDSSVPSSPRLSSLNSTTTSPSLPNPSPPSKEKARLSIRDSFRVLVSDKYLGNIAKMVLSYGLAIEFTEIIWKAIVKKGPLPPPPPSLFSSQLALLLISPVSSLPHPD